MTTRSFLAINSGSSTIKYALFTLGASPIERQRNSIDATDRATAAARLFAAMGSDVDTHALAGVGHRIVHGGPTYVSPELVTPRVIDGLKSIVSFAPNHLPDAIRLIEDVGRERPGLPQIVCFDTAFHAHLPPIARRLPIPSVYDAAGIRRYGFHGLSYEFLMQELRRIDQARAEGAIVLAHLGNGSSLAGVRGGRCLDTTMGFTPIGGIVMGTRSGDIDPGTIGALARTSGLDAARIERVLSHESGLLGISGRTADMRELLEREADEPDCRLAVDIYCYEIRKRIAGYAAALGGLDALVFSGGIGEHAAAVRARACEGLDVVGVRIDGARNDAHATVISTSTSPVAVFVIPTDEEGIIAQAASRLLPAASPRP
jgi:acetate kinase